MPEAACPALVLSGGGARGAYEAGIVCGIVEALGLSRDDASPFRIFVGTSVGAINVSYLAAHAHRGDLAAHDLAGLWRRLELREHLRVDPLGMVRWQHPLFRFLRRRNPDVGERIGRSLLDPRPFERIVRNEVPWDRLHQNVQTGTVSALIVAALDVGSGRTTMFAELGPEVLFEPSKDPQRQASLGPIAAEHVLASAAIPVLFPARRVGDSFFCDGGLRFNTPIAPAIRSGGNRLVIVSLKHESEHLPAQVQETAREYPSFSFLLGKLLNALLLDPMRYDLQVLNRFNRLVEVLENTLEPDELERVRHVLVENRGLPYRKLETLVFSPSEDIGVLAGEYVQEHAPARDAGYLTRRLIRAAARSRDGESDLASYLLFDGRFADRLIDLGRRDALDRADDVRKFFAS